MDIRESIQLTEGSRVEGNVVYGVKFLGNRSVNVNEDGSHNVYPLESRAEALPLYEGASVFLDHPDRDNPSAERSYAEKIGRLRGVEALESGSFGNLHVNPKHSLAEQILWDAKNSPDSLGLSHNAVGRGRVDGEQCIIESITAVRSVDLVAAPATCNSLFESKRETPMDVVTKLVELVESVDESALLTILTDSKTLADEKVSKALRLLFQALRAELGKSAPPPELPADSARPPAPPTFANAAMAAVDDTESQKPQDDEEAMKLQEALDKIAALEAEKAEAEVRAARDAKVADSGVSVTEAFRKAVYSADSDEDVDALIEDRKRIEFHQEPESGSPTASSYSRDNFKTFLEG